MNKKHVETWAVFFNMFAAGCSYAKWAEGKNPYGWEIAAVLISASLLVIFYGKNSR